MTILLFAVLASAEICAAPLKGGVGDPQFCRVERAQEIETPFFTVVVEPELLVGVDREGRRLRVQPTLLKEAAQFTIEVFDGTDLPQWPDCTEITETPVNLVTWHDCRVVSKGFYGRRLAARLESKHVLIEYRYGPEGTTLSPALERMTQSVRVRAN